MVVVVVVEWFTVESGSRMEKMDAQADKHKAVWEEFQTHDEDVNKVTKMVRQLLIGGTHLFH